MNIRVSSACTAWPRSAPSSPSAPGLPATEPEILDCLPELARGQTLELRVAAQRLREAGLLRASGSSTRFFGRHAGRFELLPAGQPNHVRLRRSVD